MFVGVKSCMVDFGRTIRLGSKYSLLISSLAVELSAYATIVVFGYHNMAIWITTIPIVHANEHDRPAPLMIGEKGKLLQAKVWDEIVEALEKDVPEVKQLIRR